MLKIFIVYSCFYYCSHIVVIFNLDAFFLKKAFKSYIFKKQSVTQEFMIAHGGERDSVFYYWSVQLLILKLRFLTSDCFIRMPSLREVRDMLLFAHSENLINDEEL